METVFFSINNVNIVGRDVRQTGEAVDETLKINPEANMMIDGKLVQAEAGGTFDNVNPSTEEVLGSVTDATAADMHRAIGTRRGGPSTKPAGLPMAPCASDASNSCRRRSRTRSSNCESS